MKQSDVFFKIGEFNTYIYTFKYEDSYIDEYIHCIIKEHIEIDTENLPIKIKVSQIHNLKNFVNGDEGNTSERILFVGHLKPIVVYK